MCREEELEKEIKELEIQLREREVSVPAHSVRPQQILVIEELEAGIEEKKGISGIEKKARIGLSS